MTDDALVADVRPFVAAIPLAEFARITDRASDIAPFTLTPACRCPRFERRTSACQPAHPYVARMSQGRNLRNSGGSALGPHLEVVGANAVATGWCSALRASILTTMCLSGSYVDVSAGTRL